MNSASFSLVAYLASALLLLPEFESLAARGGAAEEVVAAGAQLAAGVVEVRAELAEWQAVDARPERVGPRCQEEGMAAADPALPPDQVAAAPEALFRTEMSPAGTSTDLQRPQRLNHLPRGQERVCPPSPNEIKLGLEPPATKAFLIWPGKLAVGRL